MDKQRILVIEDEELIRETLKGLLELENYEVLTAENGERGLAQLAPSEPQPDLILLDMMMPVMNGWEFLAARRSDPLVARIPVVIVSAAGQSAESKDAEAFVRKPIDLDQLLRVIRKLINPGSGRSGLAASSSAPPN